MAMFTYIRRFLNLTIGPPFSSQHRHNYLLATPATHHNFEPRCLFWRFWALSLKASMNLFTLMRLATIQTLRFYCSAMLVEIIATLASIRGVSSWSGSWQLRRNRAPHYFTYLRYRFSYTNLESCELKTSKFPQRCWVQPHRQSIFTCNEFHKTYIKIYTALRK